MPEVDFFLKNMKDVHGSGQGSDVLYSDKHVGVSQGVMPHPRRRAGAASAFAERSRRIHPDRRPLRPAGAAMPAERLGLASRGGFG